MLARRLAELGALDRMLPGDLALLHRNGATFPVSPAELDGAQARAETGELSPSAPLFGCRVPLASGMPGTWERDALLAESLALEDFRFGSKDASVAGERRPVREFAEDLRWSWEESESGTGELMLTFTLGPGVYATALLRELMKTTELDPGGLTDEER
jgi:tRNA pseudouridine13 synthase